LESKSFIAKDLVTLKHKSARGVLQTEIFSSLEQAVISRAVRYTMRLLKKATKMLI